MFSSVYRSPSADNLYLNKLIQYIERVGSYSYDVVFQGDFNLKTIKSGYDLNKVSHIFNLFNVEQLVHKPTRVTPTSSSTTGLIFTSVPTYHIKTDVVPLTISDHYLVHTVLNFFLKEKKNKSILTRLLNNLNNGQFDFTASITVQIFRKHGIFFHEEFSRICNYHAPVLLVADEAFPLKT